MRLSGFKVGCLALALFSDAALAWRLDLNFNNGTVGKPADQAPGVFGSAGGVIYTTDKSYEGGKAVEMNVTGGDTAFGVWGGIISHPSPLKKGQEIWFRVRTFMPTGFNYDSYGEGGHLKFLRIHTQSAGGDNEGYNDWYINPAGEPMSHKFIFEGEQMWYEMATSAFAPKHEVWESYEFYVKLDDVPVSKGGQGRIRAWKNGKLLADITNRKTLVTATSVSDRTHIFTYWNGGAPKTQKMYVDDIVLTSDKPTNSQCDGAPPCVGTFETANGSTPIGSSGSTQMPPPKNVKLAL
jgi:hypothetical protein